MNNGLGKTILTAHIGRDSANGGRYYSCEAQHESAVVSAHSVLYLSRDLKDMLDCEKILRIFCRALFSLALY